MMPKGKVITAGGTSSTPNKQPLLILKSSNNQLVSSKNSKMAPPAVANSAKVFVAGGVTISSTKEHVKGEEDFELVPLGEKPKEEEVSKEVHSAEIEVSKIDPLEEALLEAECAQASEDKNKSELLWLGVCFFGIMFSFVAYGLLLEYTTSGGRKLHELSFLFVTSSLYTVTAAAGSYVRDEKPSSIPPSRFAVLGMTSMASTYCSVRSLRYVIYPIQVLAKSCKPVPVMIMGAFLGKKYPLKKYINVCLIVTGVALFMGGGNKSKKQTDSVDGDANQIMGIILLFISLCFDGGTGAYEDKLMSVHSVGPFDLMYNIQLGKTILAGVGLIVFNQVHIFIQMCQDMGLLLVALGLTGAMGQIFIFVTISKFGALTCSIIGLARKVTTLVASIYFYGHVLNKVQFTGLVICVTSMVMNFLGKGGKKDGHGQHSSDRDIPKEQDSEKQRLMQDSYSDDPPPDKQSGDIELGPTKAKEPYRGSI